jgi:hypothetical protein
MFVIVGAVATAALGQPANTPDSSYARLGELPKIEATTPPAAQIPADGEVQTLIISLADIESPDVGLSSTMSGAAFAPLDELSEPGTVLMTDQYFKRSDALRRLVALGPAALPALLASLDDKTPTKLTIHHKLDFGVMWFGNEIDSNPVHPVECRVLKGWRPKLPLNAEKDSVSTYTVKIGDVCFVAIGQIVGRSYSAVRYQPTACVVLSSPAENPKLAKAVRDIWSAPDARKMLLESLLTDYATQGIFNGSSLDGWIIASNLQAHAATRLLYYYPKETAELIGKRLTSLDVSQDLRASVNPLTRDSLDSSMAREVKNGVRETDFIGAVAWCDEPPILVALQSIREHSQDAEIRSAVQQHKQKP